MSAFKDLHEKFAYKEKLGSSISDQPSRVVKKKVITRGQQRNFKYDKSELIYEHLKPLPDLLAPDLKIVFVGFNPGVKSSEVGHRFAHHSNSFWKLIYESGIVDTKLTYEDDESMRDRFGIGFTELVMRPTKGIDEIPAIEMKHNVPRLINTINEFQPKIVCLVGKGIWESITKYSKLGTNRTKKFNWGLQDQILFKSKCFVVPSTSGLVRISKDDKLKIWKELYDLSLQP